MEDVVGVRVFDERRGEFGVLSWGRIFDAVDTDELLVRIVLALEKPGYLKDPGSGTIVKADVCNDLGELLEFEYFYEGIMLFASELPKRMAIIKKLRRDPVAFRKHVYLLGNRRKTKWVD